MTTAAAEVLASLQGLLAGFPGVAGAFVYGSVAHGTSRPGSDVDLFVVTDGTLGAVDHLWEAAAAVQRRWGYHPDPDHPVEVFSAACCVAALTGPQVARALDAITAGRDIGADLREHDDLEILRALADRRIAVLPSAVMDDLTVLARSQITAAAGRVDIPAAGVLAALGLDRAAGVSW